MTEKLNGTEISEIAKRRRKLIEIEQTIFKSRTHTSIEILVFLAENNFASKLSSIYENARATDASVRQHLRSLEKLKFIVQLHDGEDGRTKSITMTDYGKEQLALYAKELYSVMAIQP